MAREGVWNLNVFGHFLSKMEQTTGGKRWQKGGILPGIGAYLALFGAIFGRGRRGVVGVGMVVAIGMVSEVSSLRVI
jgi:hypothetical protein